ncbi:hypothetical protein RRG08_014445 [Elysia crispata]|uniref:Uncharacterized protein n=1 Tax=Elysia crispata TaxID=231223 RepID=A0AAE1CIV4_9GAST|nr:hypothetical protein RRG08_014445 [Elysia crispata]
MCLNSVRCDNQEEPVKFSAVSQTLRSFNQHETSKSLFSSNDLQDLRTAKHQRLNESFREPLVLSNHRKPSGESSANLRISNNLKRQSHLFVIWSFPTNINRQHPLATIWFMQVNANIRSRPLNLLIFRTVIMVHRRHPVIFQLLRIAMYYLNFWKDYQFVQISAKAEKFLTKAFADVHTAKIKRYKQWITQIEDCGKTRLATNV